MFKLKDHSQTLNRVVGDSFSLVNKSWAPNVVVVLIAIVISIIIALITGAATHKSLMMATMQLQRAEGLGGNLIEGSVSTSGIGILANMIGLFVGLFCIVWVLRIMNGILVRSCWNVATHGNARLGDAFKTGIKYWYVYFCVLLILVIVNVVVYLVQYLFTIVGQHWLNVLVAILTQLFVYYITIQLILVEASAVIDDIGLKGFSVSWKYISGHWWRVLGSVIYSVIFYVLVLYLVGLGIFWMVFMPGIVPTLGASAQMMAQHHLPLWFTVIFAVFGILTLIALIFTTPSMFASNQAVIYNDLKKRFGAKGSSSSEAS